MFLKKKKIYHIFYIISLYFNYVHSNGSNVYDGFKITCSGSLDLPIAQCKHVYFTNTKFNP